MNRQDFSSFGKNERYDMDIQDTRKVVRNWQEYVADIREYGRVFAWIWKELIDAATKVWIRRMLLLLIVDTAFIMAMPWANRFIFDGVAQRRSDLILWGLGGYVAIVILSRAAGYWVLVCREWVFGLNISNLDKRCSELFMGKSMGQHLQEHSYLSPANVEKGRNRVIALEETILFNAMQTVMHFLVAFVLLCVMSPVAGLLMTGALAVHMIWALFMTVKVNQVMTPLDKEFRKINRYRVERWDSVERVKANGKESTEVMAVKTWFDRVLRDDRTFWIWYLKHMVSRGIVTSLMVGVILAYGAWQVWNGAWTIGLLYPLFAWSMRVRDGLSQVSDIERHVNQQVPSIAAMMETLRVPPDIANGTTDAAAIGDPLRVDIEHLSHDYAAGGSAARPVLTDVSFAVAPGEKVALIGKSGAGKTTIMRLLLRYMDPSVGGRIRLNGHDLRSLDLPSLKRLIGYIPQQAQILDGTLRYNLTYGLSDAERARLADDTLWELMRTLQIDFGDRLTDGLDTKVGRNGVKLSGGEAQRVMIGAAALKDPRLMIIDEATSSLDALTEHKVHEGLRAVLKPSMSALIITHRLPTVRDICTKFVVLRSTQECAEGHSQVEAVAGSFEELYRLSPTFRQLADEQGVVIDILKSGKPRPVQKDKN
jgi:ABC-type multidrug transport system fused ATPase/permease subunit